MAKGDAETRRTPALVFCFNRDECWSVAEQLKGLSLLNDDQRSPLHAAVNQRTMAAGGRFHLRRHAIGAGRRRQPIADQHSRADHCNSSHCFLRGTISVR